MDKQSREMFDAMIRIAGREVMWQDVEALPSEDDIDVAFSPVFERKMKKLINRQRSTSRGLPVRLLRFAVICIATAALTFVSAFALVPSFRERVVKAVVEWTGISAGFTFAESDGICPTYIPEGYCEIDFWEDGDSIDVTYTNESQTEIYYKRRVIDGLKMSIDSEHSDYTTTIINEYTAHVFTSNTDGYPSYILFNDDVYAYRIAGYVSVEELVSIAESVPTIK